MLASLPAPYNSGDLLNGKAKFASCRSCHTIKEGGSNGVGPNLYGMFGRHVAYAKGYKYSAALKEQDFIWDAEKLDQWLTKPKEFIPGTKMTFKGLPEQKDRIDLIAYLKVSTGYRP
jgi:cytochrome c